MKRCGIMLIALAAALPLVAAASAPPRAVAVLDAEKTWMNALRERNVAALQTLLADNYVHIDSSGRIYYKQEELHAVKTGPPFNETWSEQTVDFAGNVAIVRGVSTAKTGAKTVRERYTDLYQWSANRWRALSAQETLIK